MTKSQLPTAIFLLYMHLWSVMNENSSLMSQIDHAHTTFFLSLPFFFENPYVPLLYTVIAGYSARWNQSDYGICRTRDKQFGKGSHGILVACSCNFSQASDDPAMTIPPQPAGLNEPVTNRTVIIMRGYLPIYVRRPLSPTIYGCIIQSWPHWFLS